MQKVKIKFTRDWKQMETIVPCMQLRRGTDYLDSVESSVWSDMNKTPIFVWDIMREVQVDKYWCKAWSIYTTIKDLNKKRRLDNKYKVDSIPISKRKKTTPVTIIGCKKIYN